MVAVLTTLLFMPKAPQNSSEPSFETALERLEQIVQEMEGDRLPLEDLLARYEEGTRLVKVCHKRLDSAEKRIEVIGQEASGEVTLSDFDPAAGSGGGASLAAASVPGASAAARGTASAPRRSSSAAEDVSLF
jgi:exodeoxyribonuclease VII small subunit